MPEQVLAMDWALVFESDLALVLAWELMLFLPSSPIQNYSALHLL